MNKNIGELTGRIDTVILVIALIVAQLLLGTNSRVRMAMATFDDTDNFLDKQKRQNAGQNPYAHPGLFAVVMGFFHRGTALFTVVVVVVMVMVRGQRMWDQV